jgi:hypothetical protein
MPEQWVEKLLNCRPKLNSKMWDIHVRNAFGLWTPCTLRGHWLPVG